MQQGSSLTTSRCILLWFSLNFLCNHYFECLITREGSLNGGQFWGHLTKYMSRTAIKGQVLADIMAEFIEHLGAIVAKEVELIAV